MTRIDVSDVVVVRNRRTLLDRVSVHVAAGEFLGIIGPNGAGKSTLLRVFAGDIAPSRGTALLAAENVSTATTQRLAHLRSYVGPQSISDVVFRVAQVVAMGRHPDRTNADHDTDQRIVADAMDRVDVGHLGDRVMRTLSSGEQQRVHLARAIAQQTPVVLLDEPTSALDVGHQEMVMTVLKSLAESGTTVIAALHDLNLAAAHADRVLLLDAGCAVACGAPQEVLTASRLSKAYDEPMEVIEHPFRDCPLVLTTRGR